MMDFALTEKQKLIQQAAREFAERELLPGVQERDLTEEFPMDILNYSPYNPACRQDFFEQQKDIIYRKHRSSGFISSSKLFSKQSKKNF